MTGKNRIKGIAAVLAISAGGAAFQPSLHARELPGMQAYTQPTPAGSLERASRMMDTGNFAGAIDALRSLMQSGVELDGEQREECCYMLAKALYERGDEDCVGALRQFAGQYPASARTPEVRLLEGDYYFFGNRFGDAARIYSDTDISGFDAPTRALYEFRKGVSLTKSGLFSEARRSFRLLEDNAAYRGKARFYLAYILYAEGKYDAAYDAFARLEGLGPEAAPKATKRRKTHLFYNEGTKRRQDYTPTGFEAGYYMVQIEYLRGEWRDVADHGRSLLSRCPVPELAPEINRIVGESYFKLGEPDVAKCFLTNYMEEAGENPRPTAVYSLGAILYGEGKWDEAETEFERLADEDNQLGQSANLYLGQCYARQGETGAATLAFEKAYSMGFDPNVSETALYNYVAARTRGGNIPFSSSIPMMENFLSRFPRSKFAPAVEQYLASAYFHEKNYTKAMESIERISNPDAKVLAAKQKVAYELGVGYLTNSDPAQAEKYMRIASELKQDKEIALQSRLWLGDALYAQGKYAAATENYRTFISREKNSANRSLAIYDLGYSLYMEKRYSEAAKRFREAIAAKPALPSPLITDATIRLADCLYYCGDSGSAIDSYTRAIDAGATDADYALLRRAMTHGSTGDQKAKIADLRRLRQAYPESKWAAQALLEEGLAFTDMGDQRNAIAAFELLASEKPQSAEARKGILNLAILRQNSGDTDAAIEQYKTLIRRWPSSEEAVMASDDLRKIHASRGDLRQLAAWLKSVPGAPQLDTDEIERLAFDAAERALNDDASDTARLEAYIRDYPDGQYTAQALYDLADVRYSAGDTDGALSAADRLLADRPDSRQAPGALMIKAEILEKKGDARGACAAWRELLDRGGADFSLEAYSGIMRTTDNASESLEFARRIRRSGGLAQETSDEASLFEALALGKLRRPQEATAILRSLAANPASESGARAAVELGESLRASGQLDEAAKVLEEFTDTGSVHQYWLARGFISLADVYHAQGRTSLAREYITSLSRNYPGEEPDIRQMISKRLSDWKKK